MPAKLQGCERIKSFSRTGTSVFKVRFLENGEAEAWNTFVAKNTESAFYSLYNQFEWGEVLNDAYDYERYYLVAERNGEFVGCFPLIHVPSRVFGDKLICLPFTDHGCGPSVALGDTETLDVLLDEARKLAMRLGVDYIKVCSPPVWMLPNFFEFGYEQVYDYCTLILELDSSVDDIWVSMDKSVRNAIRKAEKSGVRVMMDDSRNFVEDTYRIHLDNMKKLGTPPHSKSFFDAMWRRLQSKGLLRNYTAKYDGKTISAITVFPHRESVRWGTGVALTDYRRFNPISLLLWEAVKWAKQQGYRTFDFGGSRPNSGNFVFKRGWLGKNYKNGQVVNLNHLCVFLNRVKIADPREERYATLSSIWKRYVPEFIACRLGPSLRKQLGT